MLVPGQRARALGQPVSAVRAATVADTDRMMITHVVTPEGIDLIRAGLDALRDQADAAIVSADTPAGLRDAARAMGSQAAILSEDLASFGAVVLVRIVP